MITASGKVCTTAKKLRLENRVSFAYFKSGLRTVFSTALGFEKRNCDQVITGVDVSSDV